VLGIGGPRWLTNSQLIGPNEDKSFNDYEYLNQKLIAIEPAGVSTSTYHITYSLSSSSNRLPNGITLSSTGTLSGIISNPITSNTTATDTYKFDVVASNGYDNIIRTFSMTVTYQLYTFQGPVFLINPNLGTYSDQSAEIIAVTVYDPAVAYGNLIYEKTSGTLPPDLQLDTASGYIYGIISTQTNYLNTYHFDITATKYNEFEGFSKSSTQTFTISILKQNSDKITWVTPENLGTIAMFTPSILNVTATNTNAVNKISYYSVGDDLPTGLILDNSGDILGNPASTGTYTITIVATTGTVYDKNSWNSVSASNNYPVPFAIRKFNINVIDTPLEHTNIYAKLFLPIDQRLRYRHFIENTDIFEPDYIYRPEDTNFGVQPEFKMFVHYGIPQLNFATDYNEKFISAPLTPNEKIFYANNVNVITAKDASGTALYDVVYINIIDSLQGKSILDKIRSKFVALSKYQLQINFNFFPIWQHAAVIDQTNFVYGSVLCYAIPGKGVQILKNLKKYSNLLGHFNVYDINFTLDRFVIEKTLTTTNSSYMLLP